MSELNDEKSVKDSEPAKKSRKPALPDFRNLDYKPYVPQKDFIKTNAANARRSIVLKREAKKIIHKNGDISEAENNRRPSVAKPSYHTDYGKLPAYLTKRKKELDSEYDGGNEVSSTIPKPAQEPQSGNKEISKPGQKPRKEISPSPTGPATVQKSPGPKKERRKSMERRRSIERRRSMQKDLPRKSVHGQFKETHAPRSSITRTIERPEIDRKMENGPKRRSFENLKNQTRRDSVRDYETQRRDSIRTNETRNRTSTQEPPHERKSPTPPRDRKSEYDPRDDRDRGRPERRQSIRRNSKSRIPLATSRVKMLGDRRSSQEFHKYSNPTVHPSDTSSSQKRNLEYQDLVNSGILALPFINQYGMSNSPILPGLMPPPGVFAFQNYDPKGVMKAQSMFQAAQIQHIQASVAKAQFEANLVANKEEEKPVNQKSELQYQIKQGSSGTWIISQKKEQKKGQKEETKYSKMPAPTEGNPGDIPYIIATNQNIYIPANYPLLQFKPDK